MLRVFKIYCFCRENSEIEYLEEDTALLVGLPQEFFSEIDFSSDQSEKDIRDVQILNDSSQNDDLNESTECSNYRPQSPGTYACQHGEKENICPSCIQLEIRLQQSNILISKLKKRCAEKTAEIVRLRAAEKRAKFSNKNLHEMLDEFIAKKWVTEEGQDVLKVKITN